VASVTQKFSSLDAYTPKHLAEKILTSKAALKGELDFPVIPVS
jgi:hypothetical protein